MRNDGRQPGLLEQYTHLITRRQTSTIGRKPVAGQKPTSGTAKKATQGTIRRLMADRGFGFIQAEGKKQDLFFHRNSVQKVSFEDLKEGDLVEFDVQRDERRGRESAINIKPATKPKPRTSPKATPTRGRIFTGWQNISAPVRRPKTNRRRDESESSSPNTSRTEGS